MASRVGLIIPSSNRIVEQEMVQQYPTGMPVHITRLRMTGPHKVAIADLVPRITEATASLVDAGCDMVTFHCTANATDEGPQGEARILAAMEAADVRHASTTATAVRRALAALKARRIVLITPYSQAETEHEANYFRAIGIEVAGASGHDLGSANYAAATPQFWLEAGLRASRVDADVYFLSCANIAVLGLVDDLEKRLDRPVLTSNQVVVWDQIARLGTGSAFQREGRRLGRLFAYA